jgi:hypothetical protein
VPDDIAVELAATAIPAPGFSLNRSLARNNGLIESLEPSGYPAAEGPMIDPMVVEARRFYEVLQYPNAVAQPVDYPDPFGLSPSQTRATAPLTLDAWKAVFGFSPRAADESLATFRQRTGVVTYYNKNELGLGRELACAPFVDTTSADGSPLLGLACYVTNYGAFFRDQHTALAQALLGRDARNTVCITWRPGLAPGYEVQFYVYGPDGHRMDWAQLDTFGARAHPHICMSCHGGAYDQERHLAKFARFLPLDPNVVVFASEGEAPAPLTRAGQEERIRSINAATLQTPLTPAQRELIASLYDGQVEVPGTVSRTTWAPTGWLSTAPDTEFFDQVVKPYCTTCHLALRNGLDGAVHPSYDMFLSAGGLRAFPVQAVVCGAFTMPNAQPTLINLWNTQREPIHLGGVAFASGADALLAWKGLDRAGCNRLRDVQTCNRGPDPDAICGGVGSGTACNRVTGRCVPEFAEAPGGANQGLLAGPRGFCRTDGRRRCPRTFSCVAAAAPTPGLESVDGICVPMETAVTTNPPP